MLRGDFSELRGAERKKVRVVFSPGLKRWQPERSSWPGAVFQGKAGRRHVQLEEGWG